MSAEGWREVKLDEILNFYNGKKRPSEFGSIPVYGGNGILNYSNSFNANYESLIIGRVGAYCGNVFYEKNKCWISDNAILAKAKDNVSCKFMYYKLNHLNLHDMRIGSSQPLLTQGILKSITTTTPPLFEQKAIAATLSVLDDTIELNNQINKKLEEMAQTIFKSWFVDFEPFKDGEFEESELGLIPKGWRVGCLGEICDINMGQSPSSETYNSVGVGMPFYQGVKDFGFKYPKVSTYCSKPKKVANPFDILFSVRAPVGEINFAYEECCIGRGVSALRLKHHKNNILYY